MGRALFLLFFFLSAAFSHQSESLTLKDVRSTMKKMFLYHVETQEFSPQLAKRSIRRYIEQFDPDRLYLLKGEVAPYLSLSPLEIEQIIKDFHRDRYPKFWDLQQLFIRSIIRAETLRAEIVHELMDEEWAISSVPMVNGEMHYAEDPAALKVRLKNRLISEVKAHVKQRRDESPSGAELRRILQYRLKKLNSIEQEQLNPTEHAVALQLLKSLAKSLDAHTGFYSPKEAYEMRAMLKKEFSGVGVTLREDYDGVYIAEILPWSPAEKCKKIEV